MQSPPLRQLPGDDRNRPVTDVIAGVLFKEVFFNIDSFGGASDMDARVVYLIAIGPLNPILHDWQS
jgi:hypothetical protein